MSITCIILCKNEAETIKDTIESARNYCDELLVVDGGSTDGTQALVKSSGAILINDNGRGKGDGMKLGAQKASGDILVFMDADGSHNPQDIPALVSPIIQGRADLVIGSRILGGSDEAFSNMESVLRMLGGFFLSYAIKRLWKADITDCLNGFRAISKNRFMQLNLRREDFVIEEEMVLALLKDGGRVIEVPSHEFARKKGVSKLKTSEGWKFITYFIRSLLFR